MASKGEVGNMVGRGQAGLGPQEERHSTAVGLSAPPTTQQKEVTTHIVSSSQPSRGTLHLVSPQTEWEPL